MINKLNDQLIFLVAGGGGGWSSQRQRQCSCYCGTSGSLGGTPAMFDGFFDNSDKCRQHCVSKPFGTFAYCEIKGNEPYVNSGSSCVVM